MASEEQPLLDLGPLERVTNVHFPSDNFVITGLVGKNVSSLRRFLIYSIDGIKWTRLPTSQLPPNNAGLLVYGGGAWLAIAGSTIRRSVDTFETWEAVPNFPSNFPGAEFACYGMPLDGNGDPISKSGVFVAIGEGDTTISICSWLDQGDSWTVTKTISKEVYNYASRFVTFTGGFFFACVSGRDQNNGGYSSTFGPAAPGKCRLYTSADGVTWGAGNPILSTLNGLTWGGELGFTDPSEFYVEVFPKGLASISTEGGTTYTISGFLSVGGGQNLWHATSSSASFGHSSQLGEQSLFLSPLGNSFTPGNPTVPGGPPNIFLNGGTIGPYYNTLETNYTGGNIAAVGAWAIVALQKYTYTESTVTFGTGHHVDGGPATIQTAGYLVVSSDREGVLAAGENYFCGGTFNRESSRGTDWQDEPIPITNKFSEAGPAVVAANSVIQPNAPEDSPGTFLWVRQFAFNNFNPETGAPISNRGMEARTSSDGVNFIVQRTFISGTTTGVNIALGATPPED